MGVRAGCASTRVVITTIVNKFVGVQITGFLRTLMPTYPVWTNDTLVNTASETFRCFVVFYTRGHPLLARNVCGVNHGDDSECWPQTTALVGWPSLWHWVVTTTLHFDAHLAAFQAERWRGVCGPHSAANPACLHLVCSEAAVEFCPNQDCTPYLLWETEPQWSKDLLLEDTISKRESPDHWPPLQSQE